MTLVVGLGNPGRGYAGTRHNVGWAVADLLAARLRVRWRRAGFAAEVAEGDIGGRRVVLLKPLTYMNRSGEAVAEAARRYGAAGRVILVHDDLDLPLGRVRVRRGGGAGGHRGVLSVQAALGTREVGRVRVGIGRPPAGVDPADYVLAPFAPEEEAAVGEAVERAAAAVETVVREGFEAAMNRFNG